MYVTRQSETLSVFNGSRRARVVMSHGSCLPGQKEHGGSGGVMERRLTAIRTMKVEVPAVPRSFELQSRRSGNGGVSKQHHFLL